MPKVSRVGKFRKTASLAAKTLTPSLAPTPVGATVAAQPTSIPKDLHDDDAAVVKTTANINRPKNGKDAAQKSLTGGDSSSSNQQQQQQQNQQQQPLSRGQRKRLAKREQYLKKEQMVLSSLELKRQEDQKKRIDGLDAMKSALLDTIQLHQQREQDQAKNTCILIKTNKSRQRLVGQEVAQMSLVLQHPSFQADPFATIRQHLKNTIPLQTAAAAAAMDDRQAKRDEKKAIKKANSEVGKRKHKKRARPTRSKAR